MAQIHHAQPASYSHTLRVTFAYDEDKLHIVSVKRVAMRAPAPATPAPQEGQSGYWLEVRDANGALLYHRALHDPIRQDIEAFGDKPGDPIRRVPAHHPKGEFEVLIPDLPQAADFVLHGPPAGQPTARSTVLARHGTAELHRMAGGGSGGNQSGTQGRTP